MQITLTEKERECLHAILITEQFEIEDLLNELKGDDKEEMEKQLKTIKAIIEKTKK